MLNAIQVLAQSQGLSETVAAQNITDAIGAYIESVQAMVNDQYARHYPKLTAPTISVSCGRKYARIISQDGVSRGVHSFIDLSTGDVLKAESWKRPAKGARGNLFNLDQGIGRVSAYGPR